MSFESFEKLRKTSKPSKTFETFENLRPSKNFDLRKNFEKLRNHSKTFETFEKLRNLRKTSTFEFQLCFAFSNNSFGREKNIVYFLRTLENTLDGDEIGDKMSLTHHKQIDKIRPLLDVRSETAFQFCLSHPVLVFHEQKVWTLWFSKHKF